MAKVILYTQETCAPCHAEKLWLQDQGVDFEERDIRKNNDYLQEALKLGANATPVTLIETEDGEEVVFGFNKEELSEILGL